MLFALWFTPYWFFVDFRLCRHIWCLRFFRHFVITPLPCWCHWRAYAATWAISIAIVGRKRCHYIGYRFFISAASLSLFQVYAMPCYCQITLPLRCYTDKRHVRYCHYWLIDFAASFTPILSCCRFLFLRYFVTPFDAPFSYWLSIRSRLSHFHAFRARLCRAIVFIFFFFHWLIFHIRRHLRATYRAERCILFISSIFRHAILLLLIFFFILHYVAAACRHEERADYAAHATLLRGHIFAPCWAGTMPSPAFIFCYCCFDIAVCAAVNGHTDAR